jgi:hypothetical protein
MGSQKAVSVEEYLGGLVMLVYEASRRYLVWMLLSAFIVGLCAHFFSPRGVPLYAGQASIQLGTVDGKPLAITNRAVADVNAEEFRKLVVGALGTGDARTLQIVSDSLNARPETSETIALNVRAPTEQLVRQAVDAAVRFLGEKQQKQRDQALAELNAKLAVVDAYLDGLSKMETQLRTLHKAPGAADAASTPAADSPPSVADVWLLDLTGENLQRQTSARSDRLELETRMRAPMTCPTRIAEDGLKVSEVAGPGRPWRTSLLASGITMLGFMLFAVISGRKAVSPN